MVLDLILKVRHLVGMQPPIAQYHWNISFLPMLIVVKYVMKEFGDHFVEVASSHDDQGLCHSMIGVTKQRQTVSIAILTLSDKTST
jgi:hypothetical protein